MGIAGGPNILGDENLVFVYDTGDGNSYFGPPTTNIYGTSFKDFTGTTYSPDGEWTPNPTSLKKTYNSTLSTPIGPGATLIEESGSAGYHHLSRYGGGEESGAHSISCYLYPLSSDITDFTIGMLADSVNTIRFNLVTRAITYGAGITNRNAFIQDVPGAPGWLRVGANIEGRVGGWVGALGYAIDTSYTGTSGAKKCYITGIQYEYQTYVTPFTTGTRSVSGSLFDLSPSKTTVNVTSMSFDTSAQLLFNGTSSAMNPTAAWSYLSSSALECIFRTNTASGFKTIFGYAHNEGYSAPTIGSIYLNNATLNASVITTTQVYRTVTASTTIVTNTFYHVVLNKNTTAGTLEIYVNGILNGTQTFDSASYAQWPTAGNYIGSNVLDIGKSSNTSVAQGWSTSALTGSIPLSRLYSRVLSASEILQNYNALKSRFNL